MQRLLPCLAVAALSAFALAQSPLTTTFANNNGGAVGGAVYFDLTINVPAITVTGLDLNLTGTGSIEVYTCATTRVGNQTNQGVWTLVSTGAVTGATAGVQSPVAITPFALTAGTQGVAFKTIGVSHSYTNGNGTNQTYSTAEVTLNAGEASNVAFAGALFTPRVVNCSIAYSTGGGGTLLATSTSVGQGCVNSFASFYESFATSAAFDLANSGMTMINTGSGYLMLPGTSPFVAPSATATNLALTDDSQATVALTGTFNFPGGSTSSLTVCSNGFVSSATGNGTGFTPTSAAAINFANTAWGGWHDYLPNATNNVMFEQVGNVAYVTWNGVPDFGAAGSSSTWQIQFDLASGTVNFAWQTMSGLGNGHVVFYSPAGASVDPGNRDISATLPGTFQTGATDILPLSLGTSARPIVATSINLNVGNIPAGSPFGAILLGFGNPALDLTAIGMAGCTRYSDGIASILFIGPSTSASVPFTVPNLVGLHIFAQAAVYCPAANLTLLGAIASNGRDLLCGDF